MTLSDWKHLEITQEILGALKERQAYLKEVLSESAGIDPLEDRWKTGVIAGYQDILDIEVEESRD